MSGARDLLQLDLGPRVPAVALRVLLALAAATVALLAVHGPLLIFALAVAAGSAVRPGAAWIVVGVAVAADLVQPAGLGAGLLIAVVAVHAVAVLTALLPVIPWRAAVELGALTSTVRLFVLVEVPAQLLAVAVLLLAGRLPVLSAAALAGGAILFAAVVTTTVLVTSGRSAASPSGRGAGR